MKEILREFFGIGEYQRAAEGYMSWQHLTFVTSLVVIMVILAVVLGRRNRNLDDRAKNKVIIAAAILIDVVEIFKIVMICIRNSNPMGWVYILPLFLCSIQLITLPLAAFSRGRLKEASLDFIVIFGLLGAILGTYAAGNNYSAYPVISLDNVASGITHTISGFASLYILISRMASMKRHNIKITYLILCCFCVAAYVANIFTDSNYMFLSRGDGTPYDILFNLLGQNPVLYPLSVVALFILYITAYYFIYYAFTKESAKKSTPAPEKIAA